MGIFDYIEYALGGADPKLIRAAESGDANAQLQLLQFYTSQKRLHWSGNDPEF